VAAGQRTAVTEHWAACGVTDAYDEVGLKPFATGTATVPAVSCG
jgi:hypothetical protein